jgi:hypothetical protein
MSGALKKMAVDLAGMGGWCAEFSAATEDKKLCVDSNELSLICQVFRLTDAESSSEASVMEKASASVLQMEYLRLSSQTQSPLSTWLLHNDRPWNGMNVIYSANEFFQKFPTE